MAKNIRWMICKCLFCGVEFRMPINENLIGRKPDAYNFCSDACRNSYITMRNNGVTPKQQKYQKIHDSMGKAASKGLGINSEESGAKRMQRKYQLKKFRGLR